MGGGWVKLFCGGENKSVKWRGKKGAPKKKMLS